ncbi:hypothetical protein [Paenibacillus puerhi]|uniref:hypothetical protein n=1 Tax=Paenibacillus puerhi TaxID=2692622 RepID=UPI00135C3462|nr:hypothetical protein [Paenibacillus puerhi]
MRKGCLLLILACLLSPTPKSYALSCVEAPSIAKAYKSYEGLVVGHVVNVEQTKEYNQVHIQVKRSFKGVETDTLTVEENITWGSLWGPSEKGEDYLFFLNQKEGQWENPLCAPTKKIAEASGELKFLKNKEIPLISSAGKSAKPSEGTVAPASDPGMMGWGTRLLSLASSGSQGLE